MSGAPRSPFTYAILRAVPRVERGERINVGVVLYCRAADFLGIRIAVDEAKLAAIAPEVDPATLVAPLEAIASVAAGDPDAGPIAALPAGERFGWIAAPASTVIQPSEIHTGLCGDPTAALEELFAEIVC
ncbi:MAG: DUF3037 domain-containing protein [Gaiellales bacterium]